MAGYYPTTLCGDVDAHNCDPCEAIELGRVRSVAFVAKDWTFTDRESPTEWAEGIAAGKIIVIPQTHGELPLPSPKEGAGYGDTVSQIIAYDFALKYFDPNYATNCAFYNSLLGNRNFYIVYRTSSKIHFSTNTVTIIPAAAVPDDLTGIVNWEVTAKWQARALPCPIEIPEGIFDECYDPNL